MGYILLVYVTEQDLMVQIVYGLIKPVSFYFSVHVVIVLFISSIVQLTLFTRSHF